MSKTFDPVWEDKYAGGHGSRYPWDSVVSFVFRHAPRDRPRAQTRVLELGCGVGANVWFLAREGFTAAGVDASASAIEAARERLAADALEADLRVADFTALPFPDANFDLVIDRCSLTCCGDAALARAMDEAARVLKPGGLMLFNPYADSHSSYRSGRPGPDGERVDIAAGSLTGVGQIRFASRRDIDRIAGTHWRILAVQRLELSDMLAPAGDVHAEWRVILERRADGA